MFDDDNSEKFSLKYPDNVPKGYEISKLQYTYDFIYLVFKRDASIDGAIKGVGREYNLSEEYLMDYLVENKYLLNKINIIQFSKQVKKYNTKALKKILKSHGLKTSGKRDKIERRIFDNNLFGTGYQLSSKSRIFYKNKRRRNEIFNDYLCEYYYFREFNEFYMDNYRKRKDKIAPEFIKIHISKAVADRNHDRYISNNQIMVNHYFIKQQYRNMLDYVLRNFCMNINPIWKTDDLKNHVGINMDTYDNLIFLKEEIGKNRIISAYYVVWDSFNFEKIIVPKYEGYRILKDILNLKDYNKINQDLDRQFYSNDDLKIKKIIQKTLFDF